MGIVVIGAVFVDIKGYPYAQYIPGGRNVGNVIQVHGGVSRNIAEDIGNISLHPIFLSLSDHTGTGTDVLDRLEEHGVNTKYMQRTEDGLGTWLAVFDNNGDVVASISKRPDLSEVTALIREKGDEIFSQADSVALEIDMEEDVLDLVFTYAEKYNIEVYAAVSNMSIAMERRNYLKRVGCLVCNLQEAEMYFAHHLDGLSTPELTEVLAMLVKKARIRRMVITLGNEGAVYIGDEEAGSIEAPRVDVIDTTGAGDAFFAGVVIGLTYGKSLREAAVIGTRLAGSVISTKENTCPAYLPEEFGLEETA
ncbi:MAG: carbohydrate kinase family protein [Solobacterium sp.]|nr:carbohydrate kinase family protein [Solobacterium sp.]